MEKENMKLYELINNITPAELAKLRGKRQETSTRDKNFYLIKSLKLKILYKC